MYDGISQTSLTLAMETAYNVTITTKISIQLRLDFP